MANEIIAIPTLILATEWAALKNCTTTPCTQRPCQAEEPARGKKLTACEQIKCEVDLGAVYVFTTSPQLVQRLKSPKPQHLTLPSPVQMYCAKPESQSVRMSVSMYVSSCSLIYRYQGNGQMSALRLLETYAGLDLISTKRDIFGSFRKIALETLHCKISPHVLDTFYCQGPHNRQGLTCWVQCVHCVIPWPTSQDSGVIGVDGMSSEARHPFGQVERCRKSIQEPQPQRPQRPQRFSFWKSCFECFCEEWCWSGCSKDQESKHRHFQVEILICDVDCNSSLRNHLVFSAMFDCDVLTSVTMRLQNLWCCLLTSVVAGCVGQPALHRKICFRNLIAQPSFAHAHRGAAKCLTKLQKRSATFPKFVRRTFSDVNDLVSFSILKRLK